jgi:hypothetical protein
MPRTTLNIDAPILKDLKRLQKEEKKPLGRLVSDLLAWAIRARKAREVSPVPFTWHSRPMGARVDLTDKDVLWSLLDSREESRSP